MKTYFAASDIHSFHWEWMQALSNAGFDLNNPEHIIIVCGDLFDRGDQSLECYEFVKNLTHQNRFIYIRGNHEDLLFDCCRSIGRTHIGRHHISNGTVKTISHFLGISDYDVLCGVFDSKDYLNKVQPVLDFINEHSVDYYELGDFIFVHGWVPTTITSEDDHTTCIHENWRDGGWNEARWENGMEMARFGIIIPDKTIVCGHWHTSWGWAREMPDIYSEWGPSATFRPYVNKGIVALDACTVYNHFVNVVKFIETENGIEMEDLYHHGR